MTVPTLAETCAILRDAIRGASVVTITTEDMLRVLLDAAERIAHAEADAHAWEHEHDSVRASLDEAIAAAEDLAVECARLRGELAAASAAGRAAGRAEERAAVVAWLRGHLGALVLDAVKGGHDGDEGRCASGGLETDVRCSARERAGRAVCDAGY